MTSEEKIHLPPDTDIADHGISLTKRPPKEKAIAPNNTYNNPRLCSVFTRTLYRNKDKYQSFFRSLYRTGLESEKY